MNMSLSKIAVISEALGNPKRLEIVAILTKRYRVTVGELSEMTGERVSSVSHHVQALKRAGVIGVTPQGSFNMYFLLPGLISTYIQLLIEELS